MTERASSIMICKSNFLFSVKTLDSFTYACENFVSLVNLCLNSEC